MTLVKTLFLLLLFTLFSSSVYGQEQSRSLIVMFGDSITVGFNSNRSLRDGDGETTLPGPTQWLSDILNNGDASSPRMVRPSTVTNWGEGGTNTVRGLSRISSNLGTARAAFPGERCFVLLMYGTNDFGFGIDSGTTIFNTREMIRRIQAARCTPIVGNLTPRSDRDLQPLSALIGSVTSQEGGVLVDQFTDFAARDLSRFFEEERSAVTQLLIRLHPNEVGYQIIVNNWFNQALSRLIAPVEIAPVITPVYSILLDDE